MSRLLQGPEVTGSCHTFFGTAALVARGRALLSWVIPYRCHAAACSLFVLVCSAAAAQSDEDLLTIARGTTPGQDGTLFERDTLTGDWGGLRPVLSERGLQLGINYIG